MLYIRPTSSSRFAEKKAFGRSMHSANTHYYALIPGSFETTVYTCIYTCRQSSNRFVRDIETLEEIHVYPADR